jgi:hypothetical protein
MGYFYVRPSHSIFHQKQTDGWFDGVGVNHLGIFFIERTPDKNEK